MDEPIAVAQLWNVQQDRANSFQDYQFPVSWLL